MANEIKYTLTEQQLGISTFLLICIGVFLAIWYALAESQIPAGMAFIGFLLALWLFGMENVRLFRQNEALKVKLETK